MSSPLVRDSLEKPNIEFSCRPESDRYAPVRRTAFSINRLHPGGQLQRFVRRKTYEPGASPLARLDPTNPCLNIILSMDFEMESGKGKRAE